MQLKAAISSVTMSCVNELLIAYALRLRRANSIIFYHHRISVTDPLLICFVNNQPRLLEERDPGNEVGEYFFD